MSRPTGIGSAEGERAKHSLHPSWKIDRNPPATLRLLPVLEAVAADRVPDSSNM
jgi:hypothetical protein